MTNDERLSLIESGLKDNGCDVVDDEDGRVWVRNTRAEAAEAKISSANDKILSLGNACAKLNTEVCQMLGRALGYPKFSNDQKNFPGATDADGVCVGDHVAESLAEEAAREITRLRELQARTLQECRDKIAEMFPGVSVYLTAQARRNGWGKFRAETDISVQLIGDGAKTIHSKSVADLDAAIAIARVWASEDAIKAATPIADTSVVISAEDVGVASMAKGENHV